MKKIYLWTIIPFVLAAICGITYSIKGSYVAPDGMLVEPFFLIPLTWLFLGLGIIAAIVIGIKKIIKK